MSQKVDITITKSLLAKLMATENVTVVHENIGTAYFDLQNRILHCPIFKDMTGNLYDLLMGHEVGHALFTPAEGWHDAIVTCKSKHKHEASCYDKNFKSFLNVCEDARIEKKIKRKFNGLRKSFSEAYKELMDRDFFGVRGVDSSNLNLIDRINCYFKIGAHYPVKFTAEEQVYVKQLEDAETWEDVLKVARAIYKYDSEQPKINSLSELKESKGQGSKDYSDRKQKDGSGSDQKDGDSGEEQGEGSESGDESGEEGDGGDKEGQDSDQNGKDSQGKGKNKEGKGSDQNGKEGAGGKSGTGKGDKEGKDQGKKQANGPIGGCNKNNAPPTSPQSVTDQNFRNMEESLINKDRNQRLSNALFPKVNLSKIIYDVETVVTKFEKAALGNEKIAQDMYNYFMTKHKAHINLLLKEFEMRKNARQYLRERISKSGDLDCKKLSDYKFTDDIFLRVSETLKGKSHGIVMFLDMSSSMNGSYMFHAIEQILILTTFCDKARVPYDVYGFADALEYTPKIDRYAGTKEFWGTNPRDLQCGTTSFHLRHMISSRVRGNLKKRAQLMLSLFAGLHIPQSYPKNDKAEQHPARRVAGNLSFYGHGLGTSGTPLSETIVSSRQIIEEFKKQTKVDITNVIYLTDGIGSQLGVPNTGSMYPTSVMITDPITRKYKYVRDLGDRHYDASAKLQSALTEFVQELTGCRHIGYYICDKNVAHEMSTRQNKDKVSKELARKTLDQYGYAAVPSMGFDKYYYISTDCMGYNDKFTGQKTEESADVLQKKFKDNLMAKKAQRLILSEFAQDLATIDGLEG